uniref:Tyrosinase-like protein phomQ1' n=1 Tax=Diaporthe leptostromiformis TaxID=291059 RepID=PHQ12_DIALO|nr:RecName: Full=Tyrosinase-like protein phomQ1'; AltName: Full=Phomopsin biosynthesis cluster protein Q1' [Diaporthe leptostromiformis]AMR44289.1 tyrosinase [Diaporthe leptostromiformis]
MLWTLMSNPILIGQSTHYYDSRSSSLRQRNQPKQLLLLLLRTIIVVSVITFAAIIGCWVFLSHGTTTTNPPQQCSTPAVRKEWRSLSPSAQAKYISAVQCLMYLPSVHKEGTTLYDDFVFGHSKTGSYSHYAASFLPWHRMYLHVYERALRDHCGYSESLPYWDWTLDSHHLSASPIWDPVTGFGGDGNPGGAETLHGGRCVVDGPFANSTRAWRALSEGHNHDVEYGPHCLSRGFIINNDDRTTLDMLHGLVSPSRVAQTLDKPDYIAFFEDFESGPHNAIPQFIRGDFLTFSAPNDPVFYLHHANVDRLWWLWQQRDPVGRLYQVRGPAKDFRYHEGHEVSEGSIEDVMPMGGLAEDIKMKSVMDTRAGFLCYEYE